MKMFGQHCSTRKLQQETALPLTYLDDVADGRAVNVVGVREYVVCVPLYRAGENQCGSNLKNQLWDH